MKKQKQKIEKKKIKKQEKEHKYTSTTKKRIIFGISSATLLSISGTTTAIVEKVQHDNERKGAKVIPQNIQEALDEKVNKSVIIALISALEQYVDNPNNQSNVTVVKTLLASLKQALKLS